MNALQEDCKKAGTAAADPRKILFVCTGNTCRSPMAAALCNAGATRREVCSLSGEPQPPRVVAASAGLAACEGAPIAPEAVQVLEEAGIPSLPGNDYRAHGARNLTESMMKEADVVIPLSASHAMQILLRFPAFASKVTQLPMDIPDPFGRGVEAYRECLAQLRMALALLDLGEERAE